jgi:DNA-binding CsgD family transcriptional regulator
MTSDSKAIVKIIEPLPSLEDFSNGLASLATTGKTATDLPGYFAEKIQMMERFALGLYQWCIVDFATQQLLHVGGMSEEMTGKPLSYWAGASPEKYVTELAIAEDIPYWTAYVQFIYQFILQNPYQSEHRSIHAHVYVRMKNKNGEFRSVVMQFIDWMIENGGVRYCLCQTTDIAHIKPNGPPQMTILEVNNGINQLLVSHAPAVLPERPINIPAFTTREKQVIRLLAAGNSSKMIASILGIARNTVENHRQRLLKKSGCASSSELTAYAVSHGLI